MSAGACIDRKPYGHDKNNDSKNDYDHIKDHDIAKVKYITERGIVCEIKKK